MLAYDYPLLGVFMTMFWFFIWILWIMLLFRVIADIFRSDDLGGWGKALWLIFVILVPFLGVFVYVIARGHRMGKRDIEAGAGAGGRRSGPTCRTRPAPAPLPARPTSCPSWPSCSDQGVITDAEFQQQKAKLLA